MMRTRLIAPVVVAALLVAAGFLAGVGGIAGITAADAGDADQRSADGATIDVGASGEVTAEPDRAVLSVAVEATADDPETARQRVAENVSTLREALAEIGIDDDQIETQHYSIREDRESRREAGDDETTYRAIHAFEVETEDVDDVGTVIETAVNNGATNVGRVHFTLSDELRSELREEALSKAVDNARADAEILAETTNLTITGVHHVSTNDGRVHPYRAEAAMAGGDAGTEIESGPVTVTAQVQVTYNATATE